MVEELSEYKALMPSKDLDTRNATKGCRRFYSLLVSISVNSWFMFRVSASLCVALVVAVPTLFLAGGCRTTQPGRPAPPVLAALRTDHPRLYVEAATVSQLRKSIQGTHAHIWQPVRTWTDARLERAPPARLVGDFRRAGELIPYAALCYLLSDEERYLDLARRHMLAIAQQEHWGNDRDIEAAHLLYGLTVGYDWLYRELTAGERALVRKKLLIQGKRMRPRCARRHPPLNNHRIVNLCSLGTAALALYGEEPEAAEWIAFVEQNLSDTLRYYGSDGYSCEGISYWSYTTEYMLKYFMAVRGFRPAFIDHPWLEAAAMSPVYHALPLDSWDEHNLFLNLADSPRFCWYGPHYQLFCMAALYSRPEAQWLADQIVRSGITREHADWLSLLWYDPHVPSGPPGGLPLTHCFEEWDLAIMRSGWHSGEVLCAFKCGSVGGRHNADPRASAYPGSGHAQPDANSFLIFGGGAWLAADSGATRVKRTANHNTVIVNGVGQAGEGKRWFDGRRQFAQEQPARFVFRESNRRFDYIVGDASRVYRAKAGLTRFRRHFLYVRPNLITVVDDLAARRAAHFEWLLHTPGDIEIQSGGRVVIRNGNAILRISVLEPPGANITAHTVPVEAEFPEWDWSRLNVLTVTPPRRCRETTFVVNMQVEPAPPALQESDGAARGDPQTARPAPSSTQ